MRFVAVALAWLLLGVGFAGANGDARTGGFAGDGVMGPDVAADEPHREGILEAAREVMLEAGTCALITLGPEGRPQARAMDPFPPEGDFRVWMGTRRDTRKVGQLREDPTASLYYFDPDGPAYVTLIGRVRLVDDPAERRRRWKKEWEPYYPQGPGGEHYLLLEFVPSRLEIVSYPHEIASAPDAWKPEIVEF